MATPYLQIRRETVASTQDLALAELRDIPVAVIAAGQSAGRGRLGSEWVTAPRALAVTLAFHHDPAETRPLSLMAGVAATRALGPEVDLKWPNDLMVGAGKAGGILVEISEERVAIGLGLNLWWPDPPEGTTAMFEEEPPSGAQDRIGALWVAEMMHLIDSEGWPLEEYRARCVTLGRDITWESDGSGKAVDVDEMGRLVVDVGGRLVQLSAGAVRHIG